MDILSILWIVGLFAMMYFTMIRPQQKQKKLRDEMIQSLKKGMHVLALGGLHGYIYSMNDTMITLEVATGVFVQINRSAVDYIVKDDEGSSSADTTSDDHADQLTEEAESTTEDNAE